MNPLLRVRDAARDPGLLWDGGRLSHGAWGNATAETPRSIIVVQGTAVEVARRLPSIWAVGSVACLVPPGPPQHQEALLQAAGLRPGGPVPAPSGLDNPTGWATVVWTSGSTGAPKAIVHSLEQHQASAAASHRNIPFGPGDTWQLSLQMHHIGGLAVLFRAWHAGGAVRVGPGPVTHQSWVSTQLLRAPQTPPEHLRHVLVGGGPTPTRLLEDRASKGWPLRTTYGSTELGSQVCTMSPTDGPETLATAGRPLQGRRVRIGPHRAIEVQSDSLALGALERGHLIGLAAEDSWFTTPDAGQLNARGELVVLGRTDQAFISGGENIHPEAIERVLLSINGVRKAVVVPRPHPEWGARPVAFVDGDAPHELLIEEAQRALPRPYVPDAILPWDEAGETSTGKPRRAWFRARAAQTAA